MKVYIIKYALTQGIYKVEVKQIEGNMLISKNTGSSIIDTDYYHGKNKEWCDNKEDAIKYAEEMRIKKINSLQRQIAKIRSLALTVIEE